MQEQEYCEVCQLRFKEDQRILTGVPAGYGPYKEAPSENIYPGRMHVFHLHPQDFIKFSNMIRPYTNR